MYTNSISSCESLQGESTDNFNWGVRRRPLSEGEEREPSLRQFEESLSEKTPSSSKHTTRVYIYI